MAFPGLSAQYISSAKWTAVTAWATATAKSIGNLVRQNATPTVGNERVFVCTVAGTTHATTEPTWPTTRGGTVTDNGITWIECTGVAPMNGDRVNGPNWTNGSKSQGAISVGHVITDNAGTHVFICTVAGTAGTGAEPTWNVAAVGNTTADGTATYMYIGTPAAWAAPQSRVNNAFGTDWGSGLCNKFYVGHDHAETQVAGLAYTSRGTAFRNVGGGQSGPLDILCVNTAGSVPPVSADLRTTASINNAASLNFAGFLRVCYGISFIVGSGGGNQTLQLQNETQVDKNYENCQFQVHASAGASTAISTGGQASCGKLTLRGCTFKWTNVSNTFKVSGQVYATNCVMADPAGSVPSTFMTASTNGTDALFDGCDFSFLSGSTIILNNSAETEAIALVDCKMPASYTFVSDSQQASAMRHTMSRCSSSAQNYQFALADTLGTLTTVTDVTRSGGAIEGAQNFGWKMATNASYANLGDKVFKSAQIAEWNAITAANVTVTLYGIANATALPTNAEFYADVSYLGTAGNTQATHVLSRPADFLAAASNLTADTSSWDQNVAARQNTHTYAVGDAIKVATNPGRVFFCTASTGNTAGSEPVGYASAVDGGTVTDGSATFVAGVRFTISFTLSAPQPQIVGHLYAQFCACKPSTTYYVDPFIYLS